jgi:hypothetical protein
MGRRAARKLVEEWPTLFMFDRDHPRLSAFRPERPLDPQTIDPTEQNLQKMIHSRHVESALKLYQRMTEGQTKSLVSGTTMVDCITIKIKIKLKIIV